MEGCVEAGHLGQVRREPQQVDDRRQVMWLMQGGERCEPLECLERLSLHPHRSRVLESSMDDSVPDADQPMIRKVVSQELAQVLDRAVVAQGRSAP